MYDWNDLRCFLAVARDGSTLAASKALKVNQTTVARRIAALEEALGVKLFDRLQAGYRLTEAGEAIREDAERVEACADTVAGKAAAFARRMSGVVRVTTNETMANAFLSPCLVEFASLYPDIQVEVAVSDRRLDLLDGEADVALRGGVRPDEHGLVARRVADAAWAVYCSRDYSARRGCPTKVEELNDHTVIRGEGYAALLPGVAWMKRNSPRALPGPRYHNLSNQIAGVKSGLGLAVLPVFVGDHDPDLVRCLPPIAELDSEIWLITTERLKDAPRVRAFTDFVAARISAVRHRMSGREPAPA